MAVIAQSLTWLTQQLDECPSSGHAKIDFAHRNESIGESRYKPANGSVRRSSRAGAEPCRLLKTTVYHGVVPDLGGMEKGDSSSARPAAHRSPGQPVDVHRKVGWRPGRHRVRTQRAWPEPRRRTRSLQRPPSDECRPRAASSAQIPSAASADAAGRRQLIVDLPQ